MAEICVGKKVMNNENKEFLKKTIKYVFYGIIAVIIGAFINATAVMCVENGPLWFMSDKSKGEQTEVNSTLVTKAYENAGMLLKAFNDNQPYTINEVIIKGFIYDSEKQSYYIEFICKDRNTASMLTQEDCEQYIYQICQNNSISTEIIQEINNLFGLSFIIKDKNEETIKNFILKNNK